MSVLPQVLVFQEFNTIPSEITEPLRPVIIGPEFDLHRYTVASEKKQMQWLGSPAEYNPLADVAYPWSSQGKAVTSVVDQGYTKVFLENALLKYWEDSGGSSAAGKNKVTLPVNVVGNGATYPLDAEFYGRNVKVGDHIRIDGVDGNGDPQSLDADITGFIADTVAASEALPASPGAGHPAGTDLANGVTQVGSVPGTLTSTGVTTDIAATAGGDYDGVPSGKLSETYTVTVIRGSSGGILSTALLNVVSGSGTDNVLGWVPTGDFGDPLDLGTRGVTITFTAGGSNTDLVAGNRWTITVTSDYQTVTPTLSGTYTGLRDTTYIVSCLVGGEMDAVNSAVLEVRTTNGYDTGAPVIVTDHDVALDIGNYGIKLAFAASTVHRIRKGDVFYVTCTAATEGDIRTIIFDRSLPVGLAVLGSGAVPLNVTLYIKKTSVELPARTVGNGYSENWTQDATDLVLQAGATLFDSSWRAGLYALPLAGGRLYPHWRELIKDHTDKVYSFDTLGDLDSLLSTPIDPDNPFGYGLNKALLNSNGTSCRGMAVATDDLAGFNFVLDKLETRDDVYTLVPLTHDLTVLQQVAGHINELSSPEAGLWRIGMICTKPANPDPIVTTLDDGESDTEATFTANGDVFDVELTAGAIAGGATFTDVTIGDTIRFNYTVDAYGDTVYQEAVIVAKPSNTLVQIGDTPDPLVSTGIKIEIWRVLDSQGLADSIASSAGVFASRRVYDVYPADISSGGVTVDGYYLACALAGLRGGVVPHQGLTNVQILGFDNADEVVKHFNRSQLKQMVDAGRWLVTHDLRDGTVYTLKQVSTDNTDLNMSEQSITTNVDSISFYFKRLLAPYIGRANVTPGLIDVLNTQIQAGIKFLMFSGSTTLLGGQLIDATIVSIRQHSVLKDRIVATLSLTVPYPVNNIELHLVI